MTKEDILDALRGVKYPPYSRDIVSFGMVKYVKAGDGRAEVRIFTGGAEDSAKKVLEDASRMLSEKFPGAEFDVKLLSEDPSKKVSVRAESVPEGLAGVKFTVAVASGKGGVGKSTVAVNLARAFARRFSAGGAARGRGRGAAAPGPRLMQRQFIPAPPRQLPGGAVGRRAVPGSISFVPSAAGLILAGEIIRRLGGVD